MSAEPDGARGTNWWSVGLWAAQIALALAFGASGVTKLFQPVETLAAAMEWVAHSPPALVRFIGFAELAGAAASDGGPYSMGAMFRRREPQPD